MLTVEEKQQIYNALIILERFNAARGDILCNPEQTINYLKLRFAGKEQEIFSCIFLDQRHHIISYEEMFYGTINSTAVYPREVVKKALSLNAAAVIFSHNHPSGDPEPSDADKRLTDRLKDALELVDIRALDHVVVANNKYVSFAERGWI